MDKEQKQINSYKNLINYFTKVIKTSDDLTYVGIAKAHTVDFINELAKLEKKDRSIYEQMIDSFNGDKTKFVYDGETKIDDITDDKEDITEVKEDERVEQEDISKTEIPSEIKEDEFIKYIGTIRTDKIIDEELTRLTNKVIEDLNNPSDVLIEVWVKNYKDFVVKNNLNEEFMKRYMISIFKIYDKDHQFINEIEELYDSISLDVPTKEDENEQTKQEEISTETPTETKTETKDDIEETKTETKDDIEETKTGEDLDENEEDLTNTETSKIKLPPKTPERLKILNTKKTQYSKAEKIGLGVMAFACLSTPFITPAVVFGFMIHRLIKNYKYRNGKLLKFLEENNLDINNETRELIQIGENGEENVVTEELVGKIRYNEIKKELMSMGALQSKLIKPEYKKNRLLSELMNLNPVKKVTARAKYMKNWIKNTTEASREKTYIDSVIKRERQKAGLELDEEEEIKRGMGL